LDKQSGALAVFHSLKFKKTFLSNFSVNYATPASHTRSEVFFFVRQRYLSGLLGLGLDLGNVVGFLEVFDVASTFFLFGDHSDLGLIFYWHLVFIAGLSVLIRFFFFFFLVLVLV
jgi:hypothetical protein